ncbi:MAG TPA: acylphosphatase [Anaerolineales bacterium]|nr:acylphosphatase [Anaerolineales bacterium]
MVESEQIRLHAIVEGTVQGVGFRYFVQDAAKLLGLNGWVRNRRDGTVEIQAEGERSRLEQLLAAVRRGPRSAHVMGVDFAWQEYSGEFSDFRVRQTSG